MAVVQGLTHFQAIAAAHAMATLEFIPEDTLESASPVYRLRLAMVGRILAQNPRLYAEIQVYNPYVREVLVALEESSRLLQGFVERRDVDGFVAEFERARDALGTFRERALEESNALIQALAKRSGG
jgi:prephenate dehydrogenase